MGPGRNVVISCENVQKTYLLGTEGVPALRGVSLDVYEGEFCVIYGTSGGGKTTLLNILGTIDQPTKGNLAIMGHRLTARTEDSIIADLRLDTLGFVFQSFNLLQTMTAAENVQIPMILSGKLSITKQKERVKELLASVGMSERMDHYPSMLSGGEQQRVTIARAMANSPRVLLLDEPTGDLDTRNTKIVMDLLMKLNKEHGVTLLMVTHDPEMKWYANRAVYVQDGKIGRIEDIAPAENERALRELHEGLVSGGSEPAGLDSRVRSRDRAENPDCHSSDGGDGTTEYRNPDDYSTFCPEALQLDGTVSRSNVFAALFRPESAVHTGGIEIELEPLPSPPHCPDPEPVAQ